MKRISVYIVIGALLGLSGCDLLSSGSVPEAEQGQTFVQRLQYGVLPYAGFTGVIDTAIAESGALSSPADAEWLNVGRSSYEFRGLFRFDMKCFEANSVRVSRATLTFVTMGTTELGMFPLRPYAAPKAVTANATWANFTTEGEVLTPLGVESEVHIYANAVTTVALDTAVVQAWIDDPSSNYGIVLAMPNQTTDYRYAAVCSSDNADVTKRPYLTVYYTLE